MDSVPPPPKLPVVPSPSLVRRAPRWLAVRGAAPVAGCVASQSVSVSECVSLDGRPGRLPSPVPAASVKREGPIPMVLVEVEERHFGRVQAVLAQKVAVRLDHVDRALAPACATEVLVWEWPASGVGIRI